MNCQQDKRPRPVGRCVDTQSQRREAELYGTVDSPGDPDLKLAGLSLWALSRQFPTSDDYWDSNWLSVRASVEAPGAFIEVSGPWLRTDAIARFKEQLAALDRELGGTAELSCVEPALNVKVVCGKLGHIEVTIEITPDHMTQLHRFMFAIDQTNLTGAMAGCRRILERFPVKSTPGSR